MTREEAKELLPIMQAYAEGKTIQFKIDGFTDWTDVDTINLEPNSKRGKYRIKPEPKYRPFKSVEECWQEMQKHQPFGWVINKIDKDFYNIEFVSNCNPYKGRGIGLNSSDSFIDYGTMFYKYDFADNTPFGIKEE